MEDVLEMIQFPSPDETTTIFTCITLEPVVDVLVIEQLDILCGILVQTIFHTHVVEERLVLSHGVARSCRYLTAYL